MGGSKYDREVVRVGLLCQLLRELRHPHVSLFHMTEHCSGAMMTTVISVAKKSLLRYEIIYWVKRAVLSLSYPSVRTALYTSLYLRLHIIIQAVCCEFFQQDVMC